MPQESSFVKMENKINEVIGHVAKHLLLEQFAGSGTLFVTVDEKLFYIQKFRHHIKVEVAFDYNVDGVMESQQHSVDSPAQGVDKDVTEPVDSLEDEVILTDDVSMSIMKSENVSKESFDNMNAQASLIQERGNVQRCRKRVYNSKEKKTTYISSVPRITTKGKSTKQLKICLHDDKINKIEETEYAKIKFHELDVQSSMDQETINVHRKSRGAISPKKKATGIYNSVPPVQEKVILFDGKSLNTMNKSFGFNDTEKMETQEIKSDESNFGEEDNDSDDQNQERHVKSEKHILGDSDSSKLVSCPYCNMSFKNKNGLIQHCEFESNKSYPCQKCNRTFKFKAYLMVHMKYHHQEETFQRTSEDSEFKDYDGKSLKCEVCGAGLACKNNLKIHLMSHTSEYSHQCCVCSRKTCSIHAHQKHMKRHSKSGPIQCKICNFRVNNRSELAKHQLTHPPDCGLCCQVFSNRTERDVHLKLAHKNDDKLLKCPQCDRVYSSKKSMALHLKYHKDRKRKQCPFCGLFVLYLNPHISLKHPSEQRDGQPADNPVFACDKCPTQCKSKRSLERHLTIHSEEKRYMYTCPECAKKFVNSSQLSRHMAVHLQEKPYVCKICGKGCSQRGNLKVHMRVHEAGKVPKVVQCRHCGASFPHKNALQEHADKEHCSEETASDLQFPQQYFQMNSFS